jgi:site-specific recombinase XerC
MIRKKEMKYVGMYLLYECKNGNTKEISWAHQVKNPPKSLNELDQNRLLREVYKSNKKRDIAIAELMVGAGLRIGEMEFLNQSDIRLAIEKGWLQYF